MLPSQIPIPLSLSHLAHRRKHDHRQVLREGAHDVRDLAHPRGVGDRRASKLVDDGRRGMGEARGRQADVEGVRARRGGSRDDATSPRLTYPGGRASEARQGQGESRWQSRRRWNRRARRGCLYRRRRWLSATRESNRLWRVRHAASSGVQGPHCLAMGNRGCFLGPGIGSWQKSSS